MSAKRITATEAARKLSDLLNRVRYRREGFAVVRGGEVVAHLVPAPERRRCTVRGFLEAMRACQERPDEHFADDLEALQAEQQTPPKEPWAT